MPLTDTRLRTLRPEQGKTERLIADGNGLYIRVRGTGSDVSRTWQVRRRQGAGTSITTLGNYPELSVAEARFKAAELRVKRKLRNDTVEELAKQWLAERIDHTHRKADQVRGYVNRAIIPLLGARRVRTIEPSDIAGVIRVYRDRVAKSARGRTGGRPAARALLAVFKGLFGYAVANGVITVSPAKQLTAAITGPPPQARSRVLSDDEIRFVMTTHIKAGALLRFLLSTGLRLGEAYKGVREGQYWVVTADHSKNGREHRVWLSGVALAQLEAHPWAAPREAVQLWLKENAGGWTAHDLRRTFSTRNNGMGVPPYIVEKMLNHTFDGAMAAYNHATYDADRRAALEAWSIRLQGFTRPAADVVMLGVVSRPGFVGGSNS
jgi:integrase